MESLTKLWSTDLINRMELSRDEFFSVTPLSLLSDADIQGSFLELGLDVHDYADDTEMREGLRWHLRRQREVGSPHVSSRLSLRFMRIGFLG